MAAISFCGCSVTGFNSRLGWGENKSSLDVSVVEDVRNGDFFNPPALGMPCYFYFGASFRFWGILQNWVKGSSKEGLDLYTLTVEDPRELLAGTQLILNGYAGGSFGIPNILNCFGYWESTLGFGGADINSGGMPWNKVASAVQLLTNLPAQTSMGGPLYYRGVHYAVDLSMLPVPPSYYRLTGGPSISLLEAIQQICEDGGCDFFVELDPGVILPIIRIFTTSRYLQPPLGTISALTNTNWGGTVVRSNNGVELRNEPTTYFLIGGNQNTLYQTDAIQPFWGYDIDGVAIDNMVVSVGDFGICNGAWVDASEIAGYLNMGQTDSDTTVEYFLTEFEMRAALGLGGTWEQYVQYESTALSTNKAASIGPLGLMNIYIAPNASKKALVLADLVKQLNTAGTAVGASDAQMAAQHAVEQWVKNFATANYGREFWVALPFVTAYKDPETPEISYSADVSDAGYLPEGDAPIGLGDENLSRFTSPDGRYLPIAVYNPLGVDTKEASAQDSAWQLNGFYTKINVDKTIYIWPQTGIPSVRVTVSNPVKQEVASIAGDTTMLGIMFGQTADGILRATQGRRAFGTANISIPPPYYAPAIVGIPLESKTTTYGPWFLAGPPGRVVIEQQDLTPWAYGSTALMNMAALAKVTGATTRMQVGETGQIEFFGMPLCSLGRSLLANGPETTNIEVHYSTEGIRTNYQFRTFTSTHLNRWLKGTQERLKRIGYIQNTVKQLALGALSANVAATSVTLQMQAARPEIYPKWMVSWSSPSPVFISSAIKDPATNKIRIASSVCDPTEGWTGIGSLRQSDEPLFINSSLCAVSAIIRPFVNNPQDTNSTLLPKITTPTAGVITVAQLNPFTQAASDLEYLSAGSGMNANYVVNAGIDWDNVRGIAISAPLMLSGWGFDINGVAVCDAGNSLGYKVGPVDLLWDNNRGVWTSHSSLFGTLSADCPPGGSASMSIMGTNNIAITVYNLFSTAVKSGTVVCANYQPYLNKWAVIAADCVS